MVECEFDSFPWNGVIGLGNVAHCDCQCGGEILYLNRVKKGLNWDYEVMGLFFWDEAYICW